MRAGLPTTTLGDGTSSTTMLPAPITTCLQPTRRAESSSSVLSRMIVRPGSSLFHDPNLTIGLIVTPFSLSSAAWLI